MFELEKTFHFCAGHQLKTHDGLCARPHGHSYTLTVRLRASHLITEGPKKNMVVDFADIEYHVQKLIHAHLDHQWLNESLQCDATSLEFLAQWTYHQLKPVLPALYSITMSEGTNNRVTYTPQTP